MAEQREEYGRGLSVDVVSKQHVKNLMISNETRSRVMFEADIGQLIEVSSIEGRVLEVRGEYGTLRLDLTLEELESMLHAAKSSPGSWMEH